MYKDYGIKYEVSIKFNSENISKEEVAELVAENFSEEEVISLNGFTLKLSWEVHIDEGVYEIENELYYILDDGELGTYKIKYVK